MRTATRTARRISRLPETIVPRSLTSSLADDDEHDAEHEARRMLRRILPDVDVNWDRSGNCGIQLDVFFKVTKRGFSKQAAANLRRWAQRLNEAADIVSG